MPWFLSQTQRPPLGTEVIPGNRLTPNLGAWVFNENGGTVANNLVYADTLAGTSVTWSPYGGASFSGTAAFVNAANARYRPTSFTIAARIRPITTTGSQDIVRADTTVGQRNYLFRVSSGLINGLTFLSTTNSNISGSTTLSSGLWWDVAYTFSGVTSTVYVNGKQDGTGSGSGSFAGTVAPVYIGNYQAGLGEPFTGTIAYVYMWSRVLSVDEIGKIAANPWQIFDGPVGIPYIGQASAASSRFRRTLYYRAGSRGVA